MRVYWGFFLLIHTCRMDKNLTTYRRKDWLNKEGWYLFSVSYPMLINPTFWVRASSQRESAFAPVL